MDSVALIAPDFSIILLGLLLRLKFDYSEDFWKQAERLVFYGRTFLFFLFFSRRCFSPPSLGPASRSESLPGSSPQASGRC